MSQPKKELGQHWLQDEGILNAIVEAGKVTANDNVLEIGPGLGTLTQKLADTSASIAALEYDEELLSGLNRKFKNCNNVAIIEGDVRTFDFNTFKTGYKIIANIPYYLTSNLIRSISESDNPPSIAVLLIQKEVAERLCAKPGQMSILSATAQYYFECRLDIEVPAEYFTPPPKVGSQVVVLKYREQKLFDVDESTLFKLIKAGFSEKRKTLRNSLSGGLAIDKEDAEKLLKSAGLDPKKRAQELNLDDWHKLYLTYEPTRP